MSNNVVITDGLTGIINLIFDAFVFCFSFLRSIKLYGTDLLTFIITVFLLGIILPVIFTLVRSKRVHNQNSKERLNKANSREKGE